MNFDLMRSLLIDRALRGELFSNSNSIAAEEKTLNEVKETPFTIPNNWQWKRVADCVQFNPKVIQDDAAEVSFIPMADVEPGFVDHCSTRQIKLWAKVKKGFSRFQEGDLLVAKITPCFQNRKSCVANNLISGTGAGSTEFHVMRCVSDVDAKFLLYFFKSEYFIWYGVNHFNGTVGQQRVGAQDIKDCLIPVPPFDEQTRIVEKLEEAFAEIARAEKAYEELQTLAGVLRGQILQEAIKGKLVPQLAEEGVVEHIGAAPDEVPFEIPESWQWVQLNRICTLKSGVDMSPSVLLNEPVVDSIPYITGGSPIGQSGELLITRWTSKATNISEKGDVLLICKGSGLGRTALNSYGSVHIARQIMAIRKTKEAIPQYLDLLLKWRWESLRSAAKGVIPGISRKDVLSLLVPLPPVTEQVRIVAKVDDLLKQVNALSA